MAECWLTIKGFLQGWARNISLSDNTMNSICAKAGVDPETPYGDATDRQKDLSLAWLYVWLSDSISQSGGYTEKSADWSKSENSQKISDADKERYLRKAKAIFEEYGVDVKLVIPGSWGFVGNGFRNIRRRR